MPKNAYSGENDILVVKLNGNGAYQWHTFYGSESVDEAYGIYVDGVGNVYVTGKSHWSWDGPGEISPKHAHKDLLDIVKMAKEVGFSHVQVNTNGLKLADSVEYCRKLKEAKVNTIYMSFDGVTKKTNPWIDFNKKEINNLRKVKLNLIQ